MDAGPGEAPGRVPLPLDASGLPALDPDAVGELVDGLRVMGLELTEGVRAAVDVHARLLAAWGQHVNLTSIRDPAGVVRLHVLDSLSAVAPIRARLGTVRSVVDIGSGGGYPGIPLGLALGAGRISLVESVGRKARFLEVAGAAAGAALGVVEPPMIETLPLRAEALARDGRRGTWDVATVRAVGSLRECAELGLPLLRIGGLLVCWKRLRPATGGVAREAGPSRSAASRHGTSPARPEDLASQVGLDAEVDDARALVGQLGGGVPEVLDAGVPGAPGHRLVLVTKERPTPDAFPRLPAVRRSSAARRRGRPA